MPAVDGTTERVTLRDVFDAVSALEDKITKRLDKQDERQADTTSRLDRMEGAIGLVKWLGPAGVVAVIGGLFLAFVQGVPK